MKFRYVFLVALILSILLAIYSFGSLSGIYSKGYRLVEAEKKLDALKEQNKRLKDELEYSKSDEFVIKEAREKLNYSFPEEEIVVVPENYAQNSELPPISENSDKLVGITKNISKSNYQLWFEAFFK